MFNLWKTLHQSILFCHWLDYYDWLLKTINIPDCWSNPIASTYCSMTKMGLFKKAALLLSSPPLISIAVGYIPFRYWLKNLYQWSIKSVCLIEPWNSNSKMWYINESPPTIRSLEPSNCGGSIVLSQAWPFFDQTPPSKVKASLASLALKNGD